MTDGAPDLEDPSPFKPETMGSYRSGHLKRGQRFLSRKIFPARSIAERIIKWNKALRCASIN